VGFPQVEKHKNKVKREVADKYRNWQMIINVFEYIYQLPINLLNE
jgi:hypothetical protein